MLQFTSGEFKLSFLFFCPLSDLELYNEALKIIHEFPEYFPFGTGRNNWFFLELQMCNITLAVLPDSVVRLALVSNKYTKKMLLHVPRLASEIYFLRKFYLN